MNSNELQEQQNRLQQEANNVLTKLRLPGRLSVVGRPIQVGSSALGLMTRRDLNINVICAELDLKKVAKICADLIGLEGIRELRFTNGTDTFNQNTSTTVAGFNLSLTYQAEKGKEWNIDVCFIDEPERQPALQHIKTLPTLLNPINREIILTIKQAWSEKAEYGVKVTGYHIYDAVLHQGVTSTEAFEEWIENQVPTKE